MATLSTRDPLAGPAVAPSAVVWINGCQALVTTVGHDGRVSTCEISRGWLPERSFLAQVVRVIGDRRRVLILGPNSIRLALESEYVATFRRPDRLVYVEPAGTMDAEELVDLLRTLSA